MHFCSGPTTPPISPPDRSRLGQITPRSINLTIPTARNQRQGEIALARRPPAQQAGKLKLAHHPEYRRH
ncbi:hypothetical protein, partial [Acidiphilium sp. 20-67-58]|uniref:hypothetical protein n=1 Tax=Acidiphilium sp. 20-67-58 TaxID=1970291 RepID=UPI0025C61959